MKTSAGGVVATTVSLFLIAAAGCVDEDPIVTGNRRPDSDAGATDSGPTIATVVPESDQPDEDAADCRHCQETLSTDTARGTLCRKNVTPGGISSTRTLNALVDCVCYDQCIEPCTSYCSGSKNNEDCQLCVITQCSAQFNACVADQAP
ncbi:MAG: hypothetical protein KIT84_05180 [Labilithrix sp.]|nr:hypothetical protein [Labilithrix sp.]MCW5810379.1 hypothetical protein [Labilithrix sp.]